VFSVGVERTYQVGIYRKRTMKIKDDIVQEIVVSFKRYKLTSQQLPDNDTPDLVKIRTLISELTQNERAELIALMGFGRDKRNLESFAERKLEAQSLSYRPEETFEYLISQHNLDLYIELGLKKLTQTEQPVVKMYFDRD
jgi:hypothetical protein